MGLTIVIPAHQEAEVIGACLASLVAQECDLEAQVIVVANGCADETVEVARGFQASMAQRGFSLDVVQLEDAGKPDALNAGDLIAWHDDRIYLDADVELSPNALASIARAFARGVEFCAPEIRPQARTYFGAAYGRVWQELPYVAHDVVGAGMYAVSAEGRRRWDSFPDIVADDKFARLHFDRAERVVLDEANFAIHLPSGFIEIVRVRSRWIRANRQLAREFPQLTSSDGARLAGLVRFVLTRPSLWRDLPPFALLYACAELRCRVTESAAAGQPLRWERASKARLARECR